MSEFAYFELHRPSDDLVYQFDRKTTADGESAFRRRDRDLWIVFKDRLGWVALDPADGSVTGKPWSVLPDAQSRDHPPTGEWVSKKGSKSYVYRLVYGPSPAGSCDRNPIRPEASRASPEGFPAGSGRPRVTIRPLRLADAAAWARMRAALWPDTSMDEHLAEIGDYLDHQGDTAAFVAESNQSSLVGFIELALRSTAEACTTHPVGFIEGWYVDPESRRTGVGRALVAEGEVWARKLGCTEMGSNAELDNHLSHLAHSRLGYEEVDRLVHFRKSLVAK